MKRVGVQKFFVEENKGENVFQIDKEVQWC